MAEQAKDARLLRDIAAALGVEASAFFGTKDCPPSSSQTSQFDEALLVLFRAFARTHDAEQRALCIAAIRAEAARLRQAAAVGNMHDGATADTGA